VVLQFPVILLVSASYAKRMHIDLPAVFEALYLLASIFLCFRLISSRFGKAESADAITSENA
jgi:Ca2+/H+ antiporter